MTVNVLLKILGEWEGAIKRKKKRCIQKEKGSQRKSRNESVGGCGGRHSD